VDGAYAAGAHVSFIVDSTTAANTGKWGRFNGQHGRGSARLLEASTGAGLVVAELLDGPETGGTHQITPSSGAVTDTAVGLTYFGAVSLGSDATVALANPTDAGLVKSYVCASATTNDIVVTLSGATADLSGFSTITLDAEDDFCSVQAVGLSGNTRWKVVENDGPTLG